MLPSSQCVPSRYFSKKLKKKFFKIGWLHHPCRGIEVQRTPLRPHGWVSVQGLGKNTIFTSQMVCLSDVICLFEKKGLWLDSMIARSVAAVLLASSSNC